MFYPQTLLWLHPDRLNVQKQRVQERLMLVHKLLKRVSKTQLEHTTLYTNQKDNIHSQQVIWKANEMLGFIAK